MLLLLFIFCCIYLLLSSLNWLVNLGEIVRVSSYRVLLDMGMLAYFIWYLIKYT